MERKVEVIAGGMVMGKLLNAEVYIPPRLPIPFAGAPHRTHRLCRRLKLEGTLRGKQPHPGLGSHDIRSNPALLPPPTASDPQPTDVRSWCSCSSSIARSMVIHLVHTPIISRLGSPSQIGHSTAFHLFQSISTPRTAARTCQANPRGWTSVACSWLHPRFLSLGARR